MGGAAVILPPVTIRRTDYLPEGTFGRLHFKGLTRPIFTVERRWNSNHRWTKEAPDLASCIPEGRYVCRPRWFNKHKYQAVEISGVEGRTHILFHKANVPTDVGGCIGMGLLPWDFDGVRGVYDSEAAWGLFTAAGYVSRDAPPFDLEVTA
jgi:hypothetical protein